MQVHVNWLRGWGQWRDEDRVPRREIPRRYILQRVVPLVPGADNVLSVELPSTRLLVYEFACWAGPTTIGQPWAWTIQPGPQYIWPPLGMPQSLQQTDPVLVHAEQMSLLAEPRWSTARPWVWYPEGPHYFHLWAFDPFVAGETLAVMFQLDEYRERWKDLAPLTPKADRRRIAEQIYPAEIVEV